MTILQRLFYKTLKVSIRHFLDVEDGPRESYAEKPFEGDHWVNDTTLFGRS